MFKNEYEVKIYGVTVPVYRLQNGSVVVAAADFLKRIGLIARDVRDMVDLAKTKPLFKKRMFCVDEVSYIDVNFISAWLSHVDAEKYSDEYQRKIDLFQTQAQCIICDTVFGKGVTKIENEPTTIEEIKQQNILILRMLKNMMGQTEHARPAPVVQNDDSVDSAAPRIAVAPAHKGRMPKPISPEVAWMKSVTERIETRINETAVDLSIRKALSELYRYMNTSYGFVADQIRKEMRDDGDSKKISTLETIAHSPEWKDIFEGILEDYLANMSETKNSIAQKYEERVNELVIQVANKIGDNTPNKSKAYIKIYDEMYTPMSWKMRIGRWCHGNVPRNFTKKTMILGNQQYAERFIEVANDILRREGVM